MYISLIVLFCASFIKSIDNNTILAGFNNALRGVHLIAEEVETDQQLARNSYAHSRMCRGDGVKEPPHFLLQAAIESLKEENRRYPSDAGFRETRAIVLEFIEKKLGINGLSIDNLCPNNGVSDGFAKTVALLLKKNDVVISFAPTFGLHSRTVSSFGGQVVPIDVLDKKDFLPTIEELEEHIIAINAQFELQTQIAADILGNGFTPSHTPRVKLLNLINPSNPLGSVVTDTKENRDYYKKIYKLAEKYNFMIFDDLVYWGTEHDNEKRAMPFLRAVPEARDRVVMAFGPSKAIGGARMRTGIVVAPEWFIKELRTVILNVNSGISAFNQYVMASAFDMKNDSERELFLKNNAQEYALRRDVCIVGLLGEEEVLRSPEYRINNERIDDIKRFVRLVAYARLLIQEYDEKGIPEYIQSALRSSERALERIGKVLETKEWFKNQNVTTQNFIIGNEVKSFLAQQNFPPELHLISYVYYRELKNKSKFVIPAPILPYLDSVYLNNGLFSITIPEKYQKSVEEYTRTFLGGTSYLKIYSVPAATFFLTIDASALIGKYAPFDIKKIAQERIEKSKQGKHIPQGKNIIKLPLETVNPTLIESSREIDLLFSWIGGHNYITGELMNVSPQRGLLRMTYAEPPITFVDAIDSMRYSEQFIKPSPHLKMWSPVFCLLPF